MSQMCRAPLLRAIRNFCSKKCARQNHARRREMRMNARLRKSLAATVSSAMLLAAITPAFAEPSADLVAAAKKEGQLTTIALPHDWCGYGDVIAGFKAKYPEITINELNPDAGSGD